MVLLEAAVLTEMMIVAEVDIADTAAVDAMMIITVVLATMIASVAHMDVVMIMALEGSIATRPVAAMTATAAEMTIIAVATTTTPATVGVLEILVAMENQARETRVTHTPEVTSALTIGTPADRCGQLIYPGAERSAKQCVLSTIL